MNLNMRNLSGKFIRKVIKVEISGKSEPCFNKSSDERVEEYWTIAIGNVVVKLRIDEAVVFNSFRG